MNCPIFKREPRRPAGIIPHAAENFHFLCILVASLWLCTPTPAPAILDLNNSGISDLYEIQYNNGQPLDPNADPDGDGWTNAQEATAGTGTISTPSEAGGRA